MKIKYISSNFSVDLIAWVDHTPFCQWLFSFEYFTEFLILNIQSSSWWGEALAEGHV
jgi:hypothetical protein